MDSPQPNSQKKLPVRSQPTQLARPAQRVPRTTTVPAKQQDANFGPAFVLWVLQQWWKFVLPAGLVLAGIAAAAILYFYVPKYEASALVAIEQSAPFIAFTEGKVTGSRASERYIQTQIELLRSDVVLAPVLSSPEIAGLDEFREQVDPLKYMKEKLSIKQVGKSQLYNVKYESPSAGDAATIANAVVAKYLSIQSDEEYRRTERVIKLLEDERLRRADDVERLRDRVMALAKEVTGKDPFGQGVTTDVERNVGTISSLYQSLTDIEVNREVLKAQIQSLQEAPMLIPDHAKVSGMLELSVANRPEVRQQEAVIDAIGDQMEQLKKLVVHWETNDPYLRLQEELEENKKKLAKLKVMLTEELSSQQSDDKGQERKLQIAALQRDLATLDVKDKLLTDRYNKQMNELKSGGSKSVQLEFARGELAREEKVFELIAARKLALQTELRAPARVRLRQAASVPSIPMEPIPYKLLLLGCTAALVSPLGLAVAREMMVRRISDANQLRTESQLLVLGEISRFPIRPVATGMHSLSRRMQRDMFVFAESIDSLRTSLVLSGRLESKSVLVVTSATSGEGKTSVATSLASSIAAASKKPTVIVDADLRSPDLANVMGVAPKPGLTELLQGKCSLREAIHRVGETQTYVIPAGKGKVNPHHLIQAQLVEQMLTRLKQEFETIVIDTPPILGASESLVFAKAADTVLYCSLRDVSRARQVHVAVERLEHAGAKIAGAVLGGMPSQSYTYSYGYYENE